jgi:molybdate transport system substrate-binding protein
MRHVFLFALALAAATGSVGAAEINVYAASSLTDALREIGAGYQAQTGDRISFNVAASSTLARQIEEGAPADIFFSADAAQMDRLEKSGRLVAQTRRNVLSNTLVVITPANSTLVVAAPADLVRPVQRLALGDPKLVPVGVYARGYLERAGIWSELAPKVIPMENARAVLAAVESDNVDAGFVYQSDAATTKKAKIIFSVPAADAPAINYPVAQVQQSQPKPAAEKFLQHLAGSEARAIFEKFGFLVPR